MTTPSAQSSIASIFAHPFPLSDDQAIKLLCSRTQPCAVQVNGKLKFATQIPVPRAELLELGAEEQLREWIVGRVLSTEGSQYFGKAGTQRSEEAKRVIVVKGGRTVNFVMPAQRKERSY
ncbi:hypothetical protein H2199_001959 [Coniosporium tulheliwenetii]|uniref:Uncharacterized protein n=1 Tax=Coniosporium tulheliwenetii TaxID=3383036 RepID=A0ACC2ZKU0_9PEZI|nr:hypothetical protein H2199_001959 [Cladosporium sp. JES 115]